MARVGSVFKRCTHDGQLRETGKPATSRRPAIKACRCDGGSWWWRITAGTDPVTGRRRQPLQGGYATKAAAEADLDEVREQFRRGLYFWDQRKTLADWLREWLTDGEATGRWEPTTIAGYRSHVEHYLIPMLGHIRLRDLQRTHVSTMLGELALPDETRSKRGKGTGSAVVQRSPATVNRIRCTLRSALTDAIDEGLIATNAAEGRFRKIGRVTTQPTDWWQPDDLERFLRYVDDVRDPDVALWTVAALTGLRRSELCGLRWSDIDLTSDTPGLYVRQKCSDVPGPQPCPVCRGEHRGRQLRGGDTGTGTGSKSAAGDGRWVPLATPAVLELTAHQAAQAGRRDDLGEHWSDHDLVFPTDTPHDRDSPGAPRRPDGVTKRHRELVAAAGLPPIRLHDMRHGAASLLAAAGMPLDQVRLIMGHASDQMARHYTHGIKSTLSKHAQSAADLIGGDS